MIEVSVSNFSKIAVRKSFLEKVARLFFKKEKVAKPISLSVVLVSEKEIKRLNAKYRHKKEVTDVLSFNLREGFKFPLNSWKNDLIGEIVICPRRVELQAKDFGNSFYGELAKVLVHGILHLLGFNHEKGGKEAKVMIGKEKEYLNFILSQL